jgi:hypothetical protein
VFHDKNPLFSIHIPRDYNEITHLLDQYEDADKVSVFLEKRMKQMSAEFIHDWKLNKDKPYQYSDHVIPFESDLKDAKKQRSTEEQDVVVDLEQVKLVACEHNC